MIRPARHLPAMLAPALLILAACGVNPVPTPGDGALTSSAKDTGGAAADAGVADTFGADDSGGAADTGGGEQDAGGATDAGTTGTDTAGPVCTSTVDWSKNPATPECNAACTRAKKLGCAAGIAVACQWTECSKHSSAKSPCKAALDAAVCCLLDPASSCGGCAAKVDAFMDCAWPLKAGCAEPMWIVSRGRSGKGCFGDTTCGGQKLDVSCKNGDCTCKLAGKTAVTENDPSADNCDLAKAVFAKCKAKAPTGPATTRACKVNDDCGAMQACVIGKCGAAGVCAPLIVCGAGPGQPQVCGCDDKTHSNACHAYFFDGSGIKHEGPCK